MASVDFDFRRYVAGRRGALEQQLRDGAAYSYAGERKFRRTLTSARPVTMALEATTRYWRDTAKAALLDGATDAASDQFARVLNAAKAAGGLLGLPVPPVHVTKRAFQAAVLGTEDQPYLVVGEAWVKSLSDAELAAQMGWLLGHVQNGQVLFATAQHYLQHSAMVLVRWAVQPAILTLGLWQKRAHVTCDRAALLASRDLAATARWIVKTELGAERGHLLDSAAFAAAASDDARLELLEGVARVKSALAKRLRALAWFAEGALYANACGESTSGRPATADIDEKVQDLMSLL